MLKDGGVCSKVDDTTSESWEWAVCVPKLWGEGWGWVELQITGLRGPQTGAAVEEAVWEGMYGGYSAVASEVVGGSGGNVF